MKSSTSVISTLSAVAEEFSVGINYVQGAGGNISFKSEGSLTIKASGTRFSDASTTNIFVNLPLEQTRLLVLESEDLSSLVEGTSRRRPSIETAIHALLPHKYVIHVHSVGAISRAVTHEISKSIEEIKDLGIVLTIPYAKPGIPLANQILSSLDRENGSDVFPFIGLLSNHGLIVASEDENNAIEIIKTIENRWNKIESLPLERGLRNGGWIEIAPPGTLNEFQTIFLSGGVLTPDEAVFLGPVPFSRGKLTQSKVCIEDDGSVWAEESLGHDAIEIAKSFLYVALNFDTNNFPQYLTDEDISQLLHWDAEIYRKSIQR